MSTKILLGNPKTFNAIAAVSIYLTMNAIQMPMNKFKWIEICIIKSRISVERQHVRINLGIH